VVRLPIIIFLWSGCHKDTTSETPLGSVEALEIQPTILTLSTSASAPQEAQFTAKVSFSSGFVLDNYDLIEWSLTNITAGDIDDGGLFTTSTTNGGRTLVVAESGGLTSTADVTVIYEETATEGDLPEGAQDAFEEGGTDAGGAMAWVYPPDGVALPRNLPEMTFMWDDELGADIYRLTFSSSTTHVTLLTSDTEWTTSGRLWYVITATNAGSDVTVRLEGAKVTTSGGVITSVDDVWDAGELTFRVDRLDAFGAIYYFSTTARGVVRSAVDEVDPEIWFSPIDPTFNTNDQCVGCHVVSSDGERMAYAWAPDEGDYWLGLAELSEGGDLSQIIEPGTYEKEAYFSTFDPTGEYMVVAQGGSLEVRDGRTGEYLSTIASDKKLTMPNWSPNGDLLVASYGEDDSWSNDLHFRVGGLVLLEYLGDGQFGEPQYLVEHGNSDLSYYPMFSPDSKWIAFDRTESGSAFFAEDSKLYLVSVEGGDPIELANANLADGVINSWPRWAPVPDDDVLWIAYASKRDYGLYESPNAQIWVAAIDTYVAETGADPSYPAFRLPQQDFETSNHAPWWSLY